MKKFYISCKESRIEHNKSFYGCFSLGPFEGGQSLTIANALRRTLLSELKGLAIVSIQIEGVFHEYSSLPGIKDSVLDILLNLKEIHFFNKLTSNSNLERLPQIGYLQVRGPGVVRASDLKLPPFIQLIDPEQYIATLAEDGFLNIKFVISEGKNYIIQKQLRSQFKSLSINLTKGLNENQKEVNSVIKKRRFLLRKIKQITGLKHSNLQSSRFFHKSYSDFLNSTPLTLDAVFSPVTKVNYIIENSEHKTIDTSFTYSEEINELLNTKPFFVNTKSESKHSLKSLKVGNRSIFSEKRNNLECTNPQTGLAVPWKGHAKRNYIFKQKISRNELFPQRGNLSAALPHFYSPLGNRSLGMPRLGKLAWLPTGDQAQEKNWNDFFEIKNSLTAINLSKDYVKPSSIKHNVIIEIWTNGSIHPREALYQGLKNLVQVFSNLSNVPGILNSPTAITPLNNTYFSSKYTVQKSPYKS